MSRTAIERWRGGELRVYRRRIVFEKADRGRSLSIPRLVTEFWETVEATPYGRGLALILDPREARPRGVRRTSAQLQSGLWLDVQVRDGRPQCVGLRAETGGPEITPSRLRFALDRAVAELIRAHTVRLELDASGEVIGVLATSPESPVEQRTVKERAVDLREGYARPPERRGRPALSEEHLREVLEVARDAADQKQPASLAIAERWRVEPTTARQWLYKARRRLGKE